MTFFTKILYQDKDKMFHLYLKYNLLKLINLNVQNIFLNNTLK